MNEIYKQVKAERKAKEEAETKRLEEEKNRRSEKRRILKEQQKLKQIVNPVVPRRSSRIQNKETTM